MNNLFCKLIQKIEFNINFIEKNYVYKIFQKNDIENIYIDASDIKKESEWYLISLKPNSNAYNSFASHIMELNLKRMIDTVEDYHLPSIYNNLSSDSILIKTNLTLETISVLSKMPDIESINIDDDKNYLKFKNKEMK